MVTHELKVVRRIGDRYVGECRCGQISTMTTKKEKARKEIRRHIRLIADRG